MSGVLSRVFRRAVLVFLLAVSVPPSLAILLGWGPDLTSLPPPGRLVAVGEGVRLNVAEKGGGSALVLVHGLPGIAADWEPLWSKLAERHRVIAYDRAGYGYSDKPDHGYEISSDARRLLELIDALGLERPTLIGWSYGGAVVQEAARLAPGKIDRIVLIASVGPALDVRGQKRASRVLALLASPVGLPLMRWVFAVPPLARRVVKARAIEAYSGETEIPVGWIERSYAHMSQWGSQRTFVEEARFMEPQVLRPQEITVPALVVTGSDDWLVPEGVARDLHRRLPRSQLSVVQGASHMVPVTHTAEVAGKIEEFLSAGALGNT